MYTDTWSGLIFSAFQNVWDPIARFIPGFLAALIVLIVGLIVASALRALLERIMGALRVDAALRKVGLEAFVERAGMRLNSGKFVGGLVYWFFVVVVALAASDILGLWGLSTFLNEVLMYFPNVIVAVLIMLAALVIANFLRQVVKGSVMGAQLHAPKFLGTLTYWSIIVFGFLAALLQLGVATQLIQTIITGFIAMLALAGGIAFGLGGKEYAAHIIERFRQHTEDH
ncbi:MAG: hypothetical protein WC246_03620 [Candidatus Paceibacterota bacterium]|jgi:hypothetical protein